MLSILGFLAVLGPLVVVHELGHFLFARFFNVKAEIFSIGFGPTLFKKQWGETEYRLSWIPMGGYVKLLGAEPEEELSADDMKRALSRQAPWKRFFIFFGGPLFNFLFAIVVFMAILLIGEQHISSKVGRVVEGSVAERAGFQPGDRILAVQGKPVRKFEELNSELQEFPNQEVQLSVLRAGAPADAAPETVRVKTHTEEGYSVYGEERAVGVIPGLFPASRSTEVGVSDPRSIAAKAGIKTGYKVTEVNGVVTKTWEEVVLKVVAIPVETVFKLTLVSKDTIAQPLTLELKKSSAQDTLGSLAGLYSSELFVERTIEKSPAEEAGIQPGDRLVAVGSTQLRSFFELKDSIQSGGEKNGAVVLKWEREGQLIERQVTPTATQSRDPLLKKQTTYTIGVVPQLIWAEPEYVVERVLNPVALVWRATERMAVFSWRNLVSIRKMITGDVSVATLGGPILIGKIAGESISRGLIAFLTTMAVLSVGLGVLNILPVPVLDGGHLLLLGIEMVRGKPLTLRQMEIVQQVGLSLILLLMVVVIRNDLARLPIFN